MFKFGKAKKKVIEINVEARSKLIEAGKYKARLEDMLKREDDEGRINALEQRIELVDNKIELIVKEAKLDNNEPIHLNAKRYNRNSKPKIKNNSIDIDLTQPIMVNGVLIK
jgi:hypothetical protein